MDKRFSILVVDDDKISRTVIKKNLNKAGFEVHTAENGRQALSIFEKHFCPIVLTDWMMPEISGPELCRRIRAKKTDGYVFIVLITSKDSKTDIISGLESGADDYLIKPIHQDELIARINTGVRILKLEQSLKLANEEIRILSITDSLTGCFNRTYLNERLSQEFLRARRYHHALSAVIVDIDFFKTVNDTYGHQAGDKVLKAFAECIINQIREKIDWVVRYGGEEFLIVLPETGCSGTITLAERLRSAVAEMIIEHDGKQIMITASFGGATMNFNQKDKPDISMEQLINLADQQLYRSKREGRDRVNVIKTKSKLDKLVP